MLAYIWAEDENKLIGKEDGLPWLLPADVAFFKNITLRGDIVTGRKTYETIPARPLPGRRNIVLTSQKDYEAPGALVVYTKEDVLALEQQNGKDLYIIGGTSLFEMFKDEVDILYRTVIHDSFEGDTYFPADFDYTVFERVEAIEGILDDKNKHAHTYEIWKRKQ